MRIENTAITLPFKGREKEIEFLKNALQETLRYQGRCIIIEGRAGIGKTRLLREFRNTAEYLPFQILYGKGVEGMKPLEPFGIMLTNFFSKLDNRSQRIIKYISPEMLSVLSNLSPELLDYYPFEVSKSEDASPEKTFIFLFKFLSNLSRFYPLVIIIDDVQWLSREALRFIEYLCLRLEDMPILLVLSKREEEKKNFLARVLLQKFTHHIRLKPLSYKAVKAILKGLFNYEFPEPFLNWLFRITKGNPFFLEGIIKSLLSKDLIFCKKNGWEIEKHYQDFPLPENVVSFVQSKIRELDQDELKTLKAASIIGQDFSIREIKELLKDFSNRKLLNTLHLLTLKDILEEGQERDYSFYHPLIREVVIESMDREERRSLHRKMAEIIKRVTPERVEDIAFHKTQDLLPEEYTEELFDFLKKASLLFRNQKKWRQERRYLKLAKEIVSHIPTIPKREELKIDVELLTIVDKFSEEPPDFDSIKQLIKNLKAEGLEKETLDLCNIYGKYLVDRFMFQEAREMLRDGFSILKQGEKIEEWRLRYLECVLAFRQGEYREAKEKAERLIQDIDPKISPIGRFFPLLLLGAIARLSGDLKTSKNYFKSAYRIAQNIGDKDLLTYAYANLSLVSREMGEINEAIEYAKKDLEIAYDLGNEYSLAYAHSFLASCALLKRNFELAEYHAKQFRTLAERNNITQYIFEAGLKWFNIYLEQNRIREAKRELENLSPFRLESLNPRYRVEFLLARAMLSMEEDNLDEAYKSLNSALNISKEKSLRLHQAKTLTQYALYSIKRRHNKDALESFEKAKSILEGGAFLYLAELLVKFGREWRGKRRDSILLGGLKYLKDMGLFQWMREISLKIDSKNFPKSYRFIKDSLKDKGREEKLKIFTFGGLSIEYPESASKKIAGSRKTKELLGLLLVLSQKRGVTREILSSFLWPKMGPKEAKNNFRVNFSYLRKVLGEERIICDGSFCKLNTEKVWIDYLEFNKLYEEFSFFKSQGKSHLAEDIANRAVKLYKGDFLPEMYLLPIDDEQIVLREKIKELLLWLASVSKERLEWREVLTKAHKILQIDSTFEPAHRLIMESLYQQGDRSGAVKHYIRLKEILKRELKIDPEPETERLYKKISSNSL